MPVYDTVEQAIKAIRDPQLLAEVASVILKHELYPELVISGMSGDRGRDATVRRGVWGDEFVVIQYSIADRWPRKVDSELARYRKDASLPKRMLYVTNRTTSPDAIERKQEKARKDYGVELAVFGYGWLWPRLQREFRDLAEELLGVRPRLPERFVDGANRSAELVRRIPGFAAPIVETDSHRELREAMASMANSEAKTRVVVLVGAGGLGKTRAALASIPAGMPSVVLQAAQQFERDDVGALQPNTPGVLVIDDAHRVSDLSGMRLLLDDGPWRGWIVIMTLRPGYTEDVLERAGLEPDEVCDIAFGPLTRPQAVQVLSSEPYRISAPDVANHIMQLATGSPLMLHLAAEALVGSGLSPLTQGELLRVYVSRLLRSLSAPVHGDLAAIAALLGRLSLSEHLALVRRLHPALALPDLRSALVELSDAGLGLYIDDVFTVTPESIAPIIVLDAFLRPSGTMRLRLSDLPLPDLDDRERQTVLPTLTAAVVYGDGQGRDALRALAVRDVVSDTSWQRVAEILREARTYARALPRDAEQALADAIAMHPDALTEQPSLLAAATGTARELADISIAQGLPLLLSLVLIEPADDRDSTDGPGATLSNVLERSPASFSSPALTERAVNALAAIRRWLSEQQDAPRRQAVALRASLMVIAVAYEWVGASAADAMAIHLGSVPAPATAEHRAAVAAAARFTAELVASAQAEGLQELRTAYPALLHRAIGMYPPAMGPLPDWHRATMRSATATVRTAILANWDRLPITVKLACLQHDANRRLTTRAHEDAELDRYSILFLIIPAGRRRSREWADQLRRALELGRAMGPDRAMDLAREAVSIADQELDPGGVGNLLGGAGEQAARRQATHAITRIERDPALRPFLGALLLGVVDGAGLPMTTSRRLASNPETAVHIPAVLDYVGADEAEQLIEILLTQPSTHAQLADHLRRSARYEEATRAKRLLDLAEATDDAHGPAVLEQFGLIKGSVNVAGGLRLRLLAQILRFARVVALDHRARANISDTYQLVASWGDDSWLEVLAARRDAMLTSVSADRYRMELVPDQLTPGLHALSAEQRDDALGRIAAWLEQPGSGPLAWRVELGLEDLIVRVGAGRPELGGIVAGWYRRGGTTRVLALRLLAPLAERDAVTPVLAAILADRDIPVDAGELVAALVVPPMSWAGDLEQEYQHRAKALRTGLSGSRGRIGAFASLAIEQLERLAAEERARTQARRDSYAP